jgi:hypothetical protein
MSQPKSRSITTGRIQADNGEYYPDDVYYETKRANGNQQWVADRWADGALPTHSTAGIKVKLYTSTGNFRGYQYPNGKGKLIHYSHIQAIRTNSGLLIGDSSCYAKGFAHCTYPRDCNVRIDLTSLKSKLNGEKETIYDIVEVNDEEVTFNSGRVYNVGGWEWVVKTPDSVESDVLGL